MYCSNCGTQIPDTSKFCSKCGVAVSSSVQDSPAVSGPQSLLQQQIVGSWALGQSSGLGLLGPLITAMVKRVQFFDNGTWQNPAVLGGAGGTYSFMGNDQIRLQSAQNVNVFQITLSGDSMTWKRDKQVLEFRREK